MAKNKNLIIIVGNRWDMWEENPIMFKLNELQKKHYPNHQFTLREILHYVLFDRDTEESEINLKVNLFSTYTDPIDNFSVDVNGNYKKLDEIITKEEPKRFGTYREIKGYEIKCILTACDGGGYESRTEELERRIPHPAPWNSNHERTYYEWKAAVQAYRVELENKCSNLIVQSLIR